jgi:hypothetical protein
MNLYKPLPIFICKPREICLKFKKLINLAFVIYSIIQHLKSRIPLCINVILNIFVWELDDLADIFPILPLLKGLGVFRELRYEALQEVPQFQ